VILVTIGTSDPFDRLLQAVELLPAGEEIVAQCGASAHRPANARAVGFLGYDELVSMIERARVVVTHAGAGSVLTVVSTGKRPIVVPRLSRHGEAVDDHQLGFGRRMHEAGLVELVEDVDELPAAVARARADAAVRRADPPLIEELRAYLQSTVRAHA
jgi:UDP-N-acetylglucosamine transferase subunit ALG13